MSRCGQSGAFRGHWCRETGKLGAARLDAVGIAADRLRELRRNLCCVADAVARFQEVVGMSDARPRRPRPGASGL